MVSVLRGRVNHATYRAAFVYFKTMARALKLNRTRFPLEETGHGRQISIRITVRIRKVMQDKVLRLAREVEKFA